MSFKFRFSPGLAAGLLVAFFVALAMFIRVYFPYDQVFVGDWVKYTGNDAYLQMRMVDNIAQHFPHLTAWDPYFVLPNGAPYSGIHFFSYLLAFFVWLFTLGSPTSHAVDVIGVYFPAVLAALTVIPVYFIGKALFNRWAGVIAAGMISVMPGEFLGRSILGGTDQHVAETLFITVAAMFTIYALKSGWQNQLSWEHILKRNWKTIRKSVIYSLLAGAFLGIYLITWAGALMFIFIFLIYIVLQSIFDHFKGQNSFYLGFSGFFIGLVGLLIFLPVDGYTSHKVALVIATVIPLILAFISSYMAGRKLNIFFYPALLVVVGAVFVIAFRLINPVMFDNMMTQFATVFNPGGATGATTIEMQPFLYPTGSFTTVVAWGNFTTSMFLIPWAPIPGLAIISLVALIILYIKKRADDKPLLFLFIWTLVMLIATLAQRRFAYYLVINMAILSSYLSWQFIWWFSQRRNRLENPVTLKEQYKRSALIGITGGILLFGISFILTHVMYFFIPLFVLGLLSVFYGFWAWVRLKNKDEYMILWAFLFPVGIAVLALSKDESVKSTAAQKIKVQPPALKLNPWLRAGNIVTLVLIVFMAVFWPNWDRAVGTEAERGLAGKATYAPSDGWEETLHWLKNNTPEPLPDGSYYENYGVPSDYRFHYPETAYGVTAWWDYGYWIMRTARRLPNANPSQDAINIISVANLFLSTDQQDTRDMVKTMNSAYIVLDTETVTSKLWAIATWAGKENNKYSIMFYYQDTDGQVAPIEVYTIEYYKLLSVRLFNFNGQAASAQPMVITWEEKNTTSGTRIRLVQDAQEFDSYEAAQQYVSENPDKNMFIGGSSPFISPIPLEAVTDYQLVYSCSTEIKVTETQSSSTVKVFQYIGPK